MQAARLHGRWLRWLGAGILCVGAMRHWHAQGVTSCTPSSAEKAVFTLGLIADVQFADVDDGWNYARTVRRAFRGALVQLGRAVNWWNALDIVAVAQLGDLADGRNAALGQTEAAFERAMRELRRLRAPVLHLVGNHELYNFKREGLSSRLDGAAPFYSFVPAAGHRILVLGSYQEATLGWPEGDPHRERALQTLREHNSNDMTGGDWFRGLSGLDRRWVPYNGGLGAEQLAWLRQELRAARHKGERVVVLSHIVMHPAACDGTTMLWDYEEALREIHRAGCVVAVICGHDHAGGFHRDEAGVHHLTLKSPLNRGDEGSAYGSLQMYAGAMLVFGPQIDDLLPASGAALPSAVKVEGGCQGRRFEFTASGDRSATTSLSTTPI